MKYPRIRATSDGESRFEDVSVPLKATQLVPGLHSQHAQRSDC